MRTTLRETSKALYWVVVLVVLLGVLTGGVLCIQSVAYPWWLGVQREAVEESKSFNDSRNDALITYRQEFLRLKERIAETEDEEIRGVYASQQRAILDDMCQMTQTMNSGTVAPSIVQFLSQHGGC